MGSWWTWVSVAAKSGDDLLSLPEYAELTPAQRELARDACDRRLGCTGRSLSILAMAVVMLPIAFALRATWDWGPWGEVTYDLIFLVLIASSAFVFWWWRRRHRQIPGIRRAIAEVIWHGHPHYCVDCGYDLRGSAGPTCPECGRSVRVECAADPMRQSWLVRGGRWLGQALHRMRRPTR